MSAADRWQSGELFEPAPLHFWATWSNAVDSASPVAYRPGLIRGTEIPIYPLGFPVFSAALISVVGPIGAYLTAPLAAAILTWCTFAIARMLAGAWAGLIAAVLIAATPVTLLHTVHPMSDVPAAACWAVAWLMSLRGSRSAALASGAAVAGAVLIRPNLAPLALIPGALLLLGSRREGGSRRAWQWRSAALFAITSAAGLAVVAWSQQVLYGGPFVPGYVEWRTFFRVEHIVPNLELYPRLLMRLHTPFIFTGFAALLLLWRSNSSAHPRRSAVIISAAAFVLLNFALLLPYLSLDDWPFVRFLLPGLTALFVLFAGTVTWVGGWLAARSRWLAPLVLIPVVVMIWKSAPEIRYSLNDWRSQTRIRLMGHYLREVLPPNAAVLSFVHSGAVRHYTGRQVVRLDLVDPASLDRVVDDLRRHGYRPVFLIDEALEAESFRGYFAPSRYGRLDWAPRAMFTTVTRIWYLDPADRELFLKGERWPVDVLQ